jgi:hypothetical protein
MINLKTVHLPGKPQRRSRKGRAFQPGKYSGSAVFGASSQPFETANDVFLPCGRESAGGIFNPPYGDGLAQAFDLLPSQSQ